MGVAERRLREKESRRIAIMDAAEHVFFLSGIEKARMDEVAEKAELSKGLLYHYFRSKDDLAHAIAHRGLMVLESMFLEALQSFDKGNEQVRGIGDAYVRFSREYRDYYNLMSWVQGQTSGAMEAGSYGEACDRKGDRCIELVALAVQNGISDGTIRADLCPIQTALALWAQTHGLINIISFKEVQGRMNVDADILYRSAMDLITNGFASEATRTGAADAS
jgi:TetR/AcrR family transcriptional regulator